jgi:hypothetical protein
MGCPKTCEKYLALTSSAPKTPNEKFCFLSDEGCPYEVERAIGCDSGWLGRLMAVARKLFRI